ncbi:hypothetical protein E5675_19245 [Sphingopyxis sp. PAMC25046]|uniref:hypothetical protein n=1 Tax=Sphingopyxis sp. PAMC25046 TaxID=2565556 RepID=UPI00109DE157|nr:hypothetical protein [Sphingopyxis sp. PAMC25046]QCB56353.1 hypothetical protein E5675_19245 [Sphingopyxis sp. PAMC25046]
MRASHSVILMGTLFFGAAAAKEPAADSPYIEVSGRLENLFDYESTNDPDDLLGHGWMTARFHVTRVLRGPRLPRVITVRYFGHAFLQDRKTRLTLRRGDDGVYLVCVPAGSTGIQCP